MSEMIKNVLHALPELEKSISRFGNIFIGLDYDGTLSALQNNPDDAVLSPHMREVLMRLAQDSRYKRAIITGRAIRKVRELMDVPGYAFIGNHGYEIESPEFSYVYSNPEWQVKLDEICTSLEIHLSRIEEVRVERKGPTASVHYKGVAKHNMPVAAAIFYKILSAYTEVHITTGKHVFELRPPDGTDKGKAVKYYLDRIYGSGWKESTYFIYVGDDSTDEDVFKVIDGNGTGIKVFESCPGAESTAARYCLRDIDEVRIFIRWLTER